MVRKGLKLSKTLMAGKKSSKKGSKKAGKKSGKKTGKKNGKKSGKSKRSTSSAKSLKSKALPPDLLSPAAMENLYFIAHDAPDALEKRGFSLSATTKKKKKGVKKGRKKKKK